MALSYPLRTSSFDKALESFRAKCGLTPKELSEMEATTLLDLQKVLAKMQQSQQQSRTMVHLGRLQPFLDAMEQYGEVVNVFVNTSNIVAFIWGPMKFILLTASNVAQALNALLEGYLVIGEDMPLLLQYRQLFETNQFMQTALASVFEDILDFHLEAVRLFKQKTWKQLFHVTQRTLSKRIEEIAKSMQRHKAIIGAQTTIIQYQEFEASRMLMKNEFTELRTAERDRRYMRAQDWLGSTVDSLIRHEDAKQDRFHGTGQWLMNHQRFRDWVAPNQCTDPLLWLHGMPGAGKTMLASQVVDETKHVTGAISLCFYCRHTDDQKNGFLVMAKSMISQILAWNKALTDYIYEEMSWSGEATLTSSTLTKKLLRVSLETCRKVYIVIDGLDEYSRENRKEITSWMQQLIQELSQADFGSVRCLFVSQEDGFARKDLCMLSQIKITQVENRADIEAYCLHWHQSIEFKFGPLIKPEHHVAKIVSARAQGMFLYAKLVTWNLLEQTSRADFESEMDPGRVPTGLDQAYDRIVERLLGAAVPLRRRTNVQRLLSWLACARRPLKWYEIQGAVAVDLDSGSHSVKHQLQEDCKDLCASLVDILSDQTVTLVHSTTKQYLVQNGFVKVQETECDLATVSIAYLSMQEFEHGRSEDDIERSYLQGFYSFAQYAACFWPLHVESAVRDFADSKVSSDKLDLLSECLETFYNVHWVAEGTAEVVSATLQDHLSALRPYADFDRTCEAVSTAKSWLRPAGKGPSEENILRLPCIMSRLQTIFERLVSSARLTDDMEARILQHYGCSHYKCRRLNCQYFYRGFTSPSQRDQHVAKHDRSFTCGWGGCPYEVIGFTSSKSLQKHVSEQHGVNPESEELEFPEQQSSASGQRQDVPGRFRCTICPKMFSKAYNLKSHVRSHLGERPYRCSICGQSFVRQFDCKRHEATHVDEKKFVCKGLLREPPDATWGCGKRFTRADALGHHFRTEKGRVCIKPLLDEEKLERAENLAAAAQNAASTVTHVEQLNYDPSVMIEPTDNLFPLPDALFAQYPALRQIGWSAVPASDSYLSDPRVALYREALSFQTVDEY